MKRYEYPKVSQWAELIKRKTLDAKQLTSQVEAIFNEVSREGDDAIMRLTKKYDSKKVKSILVNIDSVELKNLDQDVLSAIDLAYDNIYKFHLQQKEDKKKLETSPGVFCWRVSQAIEHVGLYIPGGSSPLFSSLLMLAVPAIIAGCKNIVVCTPPNENGDIPELILYTAKKLGLKSIYKVGGAQAIAAMTLGTESIPKVSKIFGPGNQYVTAAKMLCSQYGVQIDMPAGPSEVLVIADQNANPKFVAADLLSQAEHGADSQVILLSNDRKLIDSVQIELDAQIEKLPRKEVAKQSLDNSSMLLFKSTRECMDFSNLYAPEHLILNTKNYNTLSQYVINAGSVFLGPYSCESAGDYASGTNHTLPTNGYAKSYSGVSLDSFVKKITFQELTKEGIRNLGPSVEILAEAEQLQGHKEAVSIRLKSL
jgi:histidinol dehydrogenase